MKLGDGMRWVGWALVAQKTRSLLTLVGMAIGICSVCLMSALGEGLRNYIMQEFTQFGSHILAITPGKTETFGLGGILNTLRPLSLQDSQALQQLSGIQQVVPVVFGTARLSSGDHARYANVAGVTPPGQQVWRLQLAQGRFLPQDTLENPRAFVVLGSRVKRELFGDGRALGGYLSIGGSRFRVVGVLADKGQFMGTDLDDTVYVPVARALQLFNRDSLMEIDLVYASNLTPDEIKARVRQLLIKRHRVEDFTIISQDEVLKTLDKILRMVKYAAGALGAISLLVGAVGILSIMLITTTERTREIGLLRALGFTAVQIRNLFLAEAVALALAGGLCGLAITALLMWAIQLVWAGLPLMLTPVAVVIALGISIVIGVLAGLRPAQQAAAMKPIEALRYDG